MSWRERMGLITKQQEEIESDELDWENAEAQEPAKKVVPLHRGPNIATYNLQLFSPPSRDVVEGDPTYTQPGETEADKRVLADLPAMLEQLEEALEALLPEGYSVRITEWNK